MRPDLAATLTKAVLDLTERVRALEKQASKKPRTPTKKPPRVSQAHLAPPPIRDLIRQAADLFGVNQSDITGRNRSAIYVLPRQWVMYEAYLLGKSQPVIARALDRDSSTVRAGIKAERARREESAEPIFHTRRPALIVWPEESPPS